jgi:hypothetical protein
MRRRVDYIRTCNFIRMGRKKEREIQERLRERERTLYEKNEHE